MLGIIVKGKSTFFLKKNILTLNGKASFFFCLHNGNNGKKLQIYYLGKKKIFSIIIWRLYYFWDNLFNSDDFLKRKRKK